MGGDPENDTGVWFRPVWETEDSEDFALPSPSLARKPPAGPDYDHPLLTPLARAQDALTRLEATTKAASAVVAEGLRARMSYLEASGWLEHAHLWIHPWDLALRDYGGVTSYGAAARSDRLATVMPATIAQHADVDSLVETGGIGIDGAVNRGLTLARMWRRLAEFRTWRPLADLGTVRETLRSLGCGGIEETAIEDWLTGVFTRERGPDLIRAGRAALDWRDQPGIRERDPDGIFLAACLWREKNRGVPIPLPFWSARAPYHHRLELKIGIAWVAEFLGCVTAAAQVALQELARLQEVEAKGRKLARTRRSRLPDAVDTVLRSHIVTATTLAKSLDVTPQAAWGLLRQLSAAGIVRETTGRASWRAYVLTG